MKAPKKTKYLQPIEAVYHIPRYSKIFLTALRSPLLLFIAILGNFILFLSAVAFYYAEIGTNPALSTFFDAIWWAFSTVSTVGFGDITPSTFEGRLVGIFLMITGVTLFVGFTAIFVSIISSLTAKDIVQGEELTYQEYKELLKSITALHRRLDRLEGEIKND